MSERKVSTDALETLGTIIGPNEKRDAIHLAVIPVEAGEDLSRGEDVHLLDGKAYRSRGDKPDGVGIVDPFLDRYKRIEKGQRFWLVIYPRVINSLRHVWTHPNLPDEPGVSTPAVTDTQKAASEAWLRQWIRNADCPDYDTVMAAAVGDPLEGVEDYGAAYRIEDYGDGPYLYFAGRDAHSSIPPEFWDHVEIVTGRKVPVRAVSFTCSC